jgi:hypothetical protein
MNKKCRFQTETFTLHSKARTDGAAGLAPNLLQKYKEQQVV